MSSSPHRAPLPSREAAWERAWPRFPWLVVFGDAPRRLATFVGVMSLVWIVDVLWGMVAPPVPLYSPVVGPAHEHAIRLMITLAVLIAGGCVLARLNGRALESRATFRTGVAYFLVLSLCSALHHHIAVWGRPAIGWAGVAVLIALFPVVLPVSPRRALVVGLMCVVVDTLGLAVVYALGYPPIDRTWIAALYRDDAAALVLAVGIARVLARFTPSRGLVRWVGGYELQERLGAGGMGEVWRARHPARAGAVAVKLIRPELLDRLNDDARARIVQRFELEVRTTVALQSPHAIKVLDFGMGRRGALYYVMELLDGVDLHEAVRQAGPLPPERVISILLQVCDSLSEAHTRGLIHRDLKPSNLYLCRQSPHPDFVKVLDFGLVKLLQGTAASPGMTCDGAVLGTPAFMSPEQVAGREVDARSDIYLLGCVAYFLLCGEMVFAGSTANAFMIQHLYALPSPLSTRTSARLPGCLEPLIMQCLEKRPEQRPATVAEVARRLRKIPLTDPWTPRRARSWWADWTRDAMARGERPTQPSDAKSTRLTRISAG